MTSIARGRYIEHTETSTRTTRSPVLDLTDSRARPRSRPERRGPPLLALLVLALLGQAAGAGASPALPPADAAARKAAEEYRLLLLPEPELAAIGALAEPLPLALLARASLLASGLGPGPEAPPGAEAAAAARLASYEARLGRLLDELALAVEAAPPRGGAGPRSEAEKAEAALAYLHAKVFRRYELDATTIDLVLDEGKYNCVSSALLYLLAMKRLGVEAAGVRTEDHAFCLVRTDGREIDVETTNAYGFDPGRKKEFADAFGKVTGYSYVPPGAYARRWTMGERELASLVLSNRAAVLDAKGRFREALSLGASYAALRGGLGAASAPAGTAAAPSAGGPGGAARPPEAVAAKAAAEGRSFFLDRVNNLAVDLERRRDYDGAEALVEAAAVALGPGGASEPRLRELRSVVAYNRAVTLAEAGRWEEVLSACEAMRREGLAQKEAPGLADAALAALAHRLAEARDFAGARALAESGRGLGTEAGIRRLLGEIAEARLADAARRLPFREALAEADAALAEGFVARRRWEELLAYLYGTEASRVAKGGDWLGAAALASEGAKRAPGDGSLARNAAAYRGNFVAEAHNRFAALYNKGDYQGARLAVSEALAALPGDPTLKADLALAEKALGR